VLVRPRGGCVVEPGAGRDEDRKRRVLRWICCQCRGLGRNRGIKMVSNEKVDVFDGRVPSLNAVPSTVVADSKQVRPTAHR
ncbi:MAG TPA: hypothetical protein VND68_00420, partial [Chloroflexia bacterium]|nr:hypothetical protein [Chloroflexia bacterium]